MEPETKEIKLQIRVLCNEDGEDQLIDELARGMEGMAICTQGGIAEVVSVSSR